MSDVCSKCGRAVADWSQGCGCATTTTPALPENSSPATPGAALRSADGAFSCTPDHAVALAYAMNLAEGCLSSPKVDRFDVAETLLAYLESRETIEATIADLKEIASNAETPPAKSASAPAL